MSRYHRVAGGDTQHLCQESTKATKSISHNSCCSASAALLLFVQLSLASVGPFCCSSALPQKCEHMKLHGGGVLALPALAVACHSGSELETTSFTPGITEHTAAFKRVSTDGKVRLIRACDMISPSQIFDASFRSRNYRSLCWSSMIFFFTPMRTF